MKEIGKLDNPVKIMRRAIKFASKDATRPLLAAVHLAANGDVVSTDAYRLLVEHAAWEGEEITVDYSTAYDVSKCKVKGNEDVAVFFRDGEKLVVKMPDGTEVVGAEQPGNYPKYRKLFEGLEPKTLAYVGKQVKPIVDEHARLGQNVRLDVSGRDLMVSGMGINGAEPTVRVEKCCEGEDASIGFDPKLLKQILAEFKWEARINIMSSLKPAVITPLMHEGTEILLMPVRLGGEVEKKEQRKEREMEEIKNEKVDKAVLMAAIHNAAIEHAANDPDGNVQGGRLTDSQHKLLWRLQKAGRLTRETSGDLIAWSLDGEFVCCIERRWSKRQIHLTHPELKPVCHRSNLLLTRKVEDKLEAEEVKAKVTVSESDGVTAITIEPPKVAPKPKAEKPKAPKPPKAPEQSKPVEDAAAVVSLESMREWVKRGNMVATQKREGCAIWVEGETKPFQAELKELGFRWSPKRKGWYHAA